ncbi:acyltransferase [Billgrantia tianxiuensis]|uniref:Acyltransferase n=1 Tax=Billgrantia tianxiuensis TaxID=2497861 RepID=A0A6I6SPJ6_9GAMM|nr:MULTISPECIES: acyltransferase family protein [Halomonas]MCE8034630.1 acyltransferase [Halomonas sp. MCCC 1A11057]QHC50496.1 acyltransferase [Halomonas tianxiuensis]
MGSPHYRPDIDGLRAIAVLSVIIYHVNNEWLSGGFVGVDMFFVISGYLITSIIYKSAEDGSFSFIDFYARRIRRIVPASFFVTLVTVIAGSVLFLPEDAQSLSESAIATALSVANVYFWLFLDTDYFAASSDLSPLLHMWSLGVEEQFYLIWPAVLIFALSIGGKRAVIIASVLVTVASFAVGEYYLDKDSLFSYYMLPSRAGELMIGGLAYFISDRRGMFSSYFASTLAGFAGVALITYSLWIIDSATGFPGFAAIPATVGTALLILAGVNQKTIVSKVLSIKAMTSIGLLSFSLYLWHWPVLSFYRYAFGDPYKGLPLIICLSLIVFLSTASYFLIEKPFRGQRSGSLLNRSAPYASLTIILLAFSSLVVAKNGFVASLSPNDYLARLENLNDNTLAANRYRYNCQTSNFNASLIRHPRCVSDFGQGDPSILLFGDSNAAHYLGYFRELARDEELSIMNISHSSCPPIFGSGWEYARANKSSCRSYLQEVERIVSDFSVVIIGANWTGFVGEDYREDVSRTIGFLSDNVRNVVIALKVPVFPLYDRYCSSKSLKIPWMNCSERSYIRYGSDHDINNFLISLASTYENVRTVSIREHVCGSSGCSAYLNGDPIYFNPTHLSMKGSEALGKIAISTGNIFTEIENSDNLAYNIHE